MFSVICRKDGEKGLARGGLDGSKRRGEVVGDGGAFVIWLAAD